MTTACYICGKPYTRTYVSAHVRTAHGPEHVRRQGGQGTPRDKTPRKPLTLEQRRNKLAARIRNMAEGPAKQKLRRTFVGIAYAAWKERQA